MANELQVSFICAYANGGDQSRFAETATYTVGSVSRIENTQLVGTSEEALVMGDVTALGYALFRNMDSTNYVEVYRTSSDSAPLIKLRAGEMAIVPLGGTTIFAKANTANVRLRYTLFQGV